MNQHCMTAPVLYLPNGRLELHYPRPGHCNEIKPASAEDTARAWGAWLKENIHKYPAGTSFYIVTSNEKIHNG